LAALYFCAASSFSRRSLEIAIKGCEVLSFWKVGEII
jgi:hypothetical protein